MAQTMTRIFDLINTNFKTLKDDKHDKSSIYKVSSKTRIIYMSQLFRNILKSFNLDIIII